MILGGVVTAAFATPSSILLKFLISGDSPGG
jgi:hypothetical protein